MEKKIDSEILFKGKIITVYKDKVKCPNDKIASREIVRHHGGVGILATIDDKIILVKQFRYAYNQDTIEIPAGKLELGEESQLAGARELEEETGYSCKKLMPITQIYPTPGYCDEIIHLYEAKDVYKVENPLDGDEDEFINVLFVPIDEAYQMVIDQKIKDSKTIIAIMKAYIDKYTK
ncbi:MAG: NUDIX hydrolase [Faecalibacillus sp.]